jgi:hypothetical protein
MEFDMKHILIVVFALGICIAPAIAEPVCDDTKLGELNNATTTAIFVARHICEVAGVSPECVRAGLQVKNIASSTRDLVIICSEVFDKFVLGK